MAILFAAAAVTSVSPGAGGLVVGVLLVGYAWAVSPAFFPRSTDLQVAQDRSATGQTPVVFWKPGCLYCMKLRVGLGMRGRELSWVDSSVDEQAQAVVRSANGGDHTTPTVMSQGETRTNPDIAWVRSRLS